MYHKSCLNCGCVEISYGGWRYVLEDGLQCCASPQAIYGDWRNSTSHVSCNTKFGKLCLVGGQWIASHSSHHSQALSPINSLLISPLLQSWLLWWTNQQLADLALNNPLLHHQIMVETSIQMRFLFLLLISKNWNCKKVHWRFWLNFQHSFIDCI